MGTITLSPMLSIIHNCALVTRSIVLFYNKTLTAKHWLYLRPVLCFSTERCSPAHKTYAWYHLRGQFLPRLAARHT